MATEAQIRAAIKHNRSKDAITIRPSKDLGARIRVAAERQGMSVSAYILAALEQQMKKDQQ